MDLVKNTRRLLTLMLEVDTNRDKKDVIDVKFTLTGRGCGAHAVVIY
jgi:metal-sulfur cluster biosynthetic enzyme